MYARGMHAKGEQERVELVERPRLARDQHDVVTHHVSAIAIRVRPVRPGPRWAQEWVALVEQPHPHLCRGRHDVVAHHVLVIAIRAQAEPA